MRLTPGHAALAAGCLGVAVLAAFPALSSRTVTPASDPMTPAPAPVVAIAPQVTASVAPAPVPAPAVRARAVVAAPAAPTHQAGMMVYLDPETGTFGPPPAGALELESFDAPLRRADSEYEQISLGRRRGFMVELDESFHEVVTVHRGADGKLHKGCVHASELHEALNRQPAPAALPVE